MEILTHAQDVEAEALADWLIHQLVRQAVKPHMSSQGDGSATFTLIWKGKEGRKWKCAYKQSEPHLCIQIISMLGSNTHPGYIMNVTIALGKANYKRGL